MIIILFSKSFSNICIRYNPEYNPPVEAGESAVLEISPLNLSYTESETNPEYLEESEEEDEPSYNEATVPTSMCLELSTVSAKLFQTKFHFVGVFYLRMFKSQRLAGPICTADITGNSMAEITANIWEHASAHVSRDVIVETIEGGPIVRWGPTDKPEPCDAERFISFKDEKQRKNYSFKNLNSKLLVSWRGREIHVYVFKYSIAITTNTIFEMVKRQLLNPEKKDRAGAPSTEELFKCMDELKQLHPNYTALHSAWEKWANFVLSHTADLRAKLMREAPPDDYLFLFRSVATTEGEQLIATRQGLSVARTVLTSYFTKVEVFGELADQNFENAVKLQQLARELKAQGESTTAMLDAFESSLPPVEVEFSRKLGGQVTNADDNEHMPR
uniref:(northern house mosquito) hypothetical protein n=1 Tax=Culex pipiens TaxID=7175 RepID=A0A8D8AAN0_CULPI